MFAIAYDLTVADAEQHHPRGYLHAYQDIETTLRTFGYERAQRSVFTSEDDDLANLFSAMAALRELEWFRRSVKNIRAFRMEQRADFTAIVKGRH